MQRLSNLDSPMFTPEPPVIFERISSSSFRSSSTIHGGSSITIHNIVDQPITPENFQKLHPVHNYIFDILKNDIPVTLIQTCKAVYAAIIPKLYEKIVIDEQFYHSVTCGANIVLFGRSLRKYKENLHRWGEDMPDLKTQALSYTRIICFSDINGSAQFIHDIRPCLDTRCAPRKYYLSGTVFPNIQHVHLGQKVANIQLFNFAKGENEDTCIHLQNFLRAVFDGRDPHTLCIDWPSIFTSKFSELQPSVQRAIVRGIHGLFTELGKKTLIKNVIIHILYDKLDFLIASFHGITKYANLTLDIEEALGTTNIHCLIKAAWNHFRSTSKTHTMDHIPICYTFQPDRNFEKGLEHWKRFVHADDKKLFSAFCERVEIRKKECGCK